MLTVAICTYRRFECLDLCIEALKDQSSGQFNVLIVDNSLLPEFSKKYKSKWVDFPNLEYIITDKSGLSFARNIALNECQTQYIAYLDDDAIPVQDWADQSMDTIKRYVEGAGVLGGKVSPIWEIPKPEWVKKELLGPLAVVDWGDEEFTLQKDDSRWLVGANIIYKTSALRKVGGFDESLGRKESLLLCHEELAANDAIRSLGYSMIYNPKIAVNHLVQKERLRAEWMFKEAYWEAISRDLYEGNLNIEKLLQEQELINSELLKAMASSIKKDTSYNSVYESRQRAAHLAKRITRSWRKKADRKTNSIFKEIMTFTIIIPTLNAAKNITSTLESIISQKGEFNIRVHIQDGGSSDETISLLKAFKAKLKKGEKTFNVNHFIFTYQSIEDGGKSIAINQGTLLTQGSMNSPMTYMYAGDILLSDCLAKIQKVFLKYREVSWVLPLAREIESNISNQPEQIFFPQQVIAGGLCDGECWAKIPSRGCFWRVKLWANSGGINSSMEHAADWELWRAFANSTTPYQLSWRTVSFAPNKKKDNTLLYREEVEFNCSAPVKISLMDDIVRKKLLLPISAIDVEYTQIWRTIDGKALRKPKGKFEIRVLMYKTVRNLYRLSPNILKRKCRPFLTKIKNKYIKL